MNLEFQFYRCRIENFKSSRCYFEILLAHLNFWPLVDRLNTVTFTRCLESELMLWFIIHVLCMQRKIQKFSQMSLSLKFINIHFNYCYCIIITITEIVMMCPHLKNHESVAAPQPIKTLDSAVLGYMKRIWIHGALMYSE